jgi:hypothetical protein
VSNELEIKYMARVAVALIESAVRDLDSSNPKLRVNAEKFLFSDDCEVLLRLWLLHIGCTDVAWFRDRLNRERKKAA